MEKVDIHAVIKYQFLKESKPQSSLTSRKFWGNLLHRKQLLTIGIRILMLSPKDAESSDRSIGVTTSENIQKVHRMVLGDRKLKLSYIAETLSTTFCMTIWV